MPVHTCTVYTHVLCTHVYRVHTCTVYIHVLFTHVYCVHTCTVYNWCTCHTIFWKWFNIWNIANMYQDLFTLSLNTDSVFSDYVRSLDMYQWCFRFDMFLQLLHVFLFFMSRIWLRCISLEIWTSLLVREYIERELFCFILNLLRSTTTVASLLRILFLALGLRVDNLLSSPILFCLW